MMSNDHVLQRLSGIQSILNGVHRASSPLSASSRGQERQAFIDSFLANVLPPIYRFGSGDATDSGGSRSGQLDVVVEYPIAPSLPSVAGQPTTRLYLAESVAAVIEVKSNVSTQWSEALHTAQQLATIKRQWVSMMTMGHRPTETIPIFVAGYVGWKNIETVQSHIEQNPSIAGILVIDPGLFVSSPKFGGITASGPWSLWGLVTILHVITNGIQAAPTNILKYAM